MHLGHETQALQSLLSLLGDKKCSGQHFMVNCQRWDPSKAKKLNRKNVTAITTKYSTSMISNLPCHQQCHAMSQTSRTPRIEPGAGQLRSTNAPSVLCRTCCRAASVPGGLVPAWGRLEFSVHGQHLAVAVGVFAQ